MSLRVIGLAIAGLFVVLGVQGCAGYHELNSTQPRAAYAKGYVPCSDSLYVALKARPLDSLSEREYEYFLQKDTQCAEYQKNVRQQTNAADASSAAAGGAFLGILVGITLLTVLVVHSAHPYTW